jgi:hypothetical protein
MARTGPYTKHRIVWDVTDKDFHWTREQRGGR